MRLRVLVIIATFACLAGCREIPASTVKEVNALDAKSPDAPNPVDDPRFKEFFDHVRAYIKIHDAASTRGELHCASSSIAACCSSDFITSSRIR